MFELNKLYHMDCMQAMKEIPDKYFEIAIVDPPYGRKEHGGKNHSKYVKQKMVAEYMLNMMGMQTATGTTNQLEKNTLTSL